LEATVGTAPVWSALLAFPFALLAALAVVLCVYLFWRAPRAAANDRRSLGVALTGLDKSWTFKDSWVTNLTAASGVIVTVVGSSEFLTAVVGSDAQGAIGVVTVAALISVAITGAAGIAVLALKGPLQNETTILGLLTGTFLSLGAAAGQVWAVVWALDDVSLGAGHWLMWVGAGLATSLLLAYGITSILGLLTQGTAAAVIGDPLKPPYSNEVVAAAILAASRGGLVTHTSVHNVLAHLSEGREIKLPKKEPHALQNRSALL
jgi:hypothetical protein